MWITWSKFNRYEGVYLVSFGSASIPLETNWEENGVALQPAYMPGCSDPEWSGVFPELMEHGTESASRTG